MSNSKKRKVSLKAAVDIFANDDSDWCDSESDDDVGELEYSVLPDPLTIVQDADDGEYLQGHYISKKANSIIQ
jgi:hypothetical protein